MENGLKKLQTGYFLTKDLWLSAKELLDYQISCKDKYKTYNNLNFYYFDLIKSTKNLEQQTYYKERIANNFFYGLEKEFYFHKYTVPKIGIGLRNYVFFSYPMQQLMYGFGLYLLKTTQQFIADNKSIKIKSFYGGDLKFNNSNNKLVLNINSTLYYNHYRKYKNHLKQETLNRDNKFVIRLDIQNYFDNISITRLLELIKENVKPSELKKYNFDSSTIEQIEFYFRFLGNGKDNIPQSDNNIISNFIGYLYLIFGDLIIEDTINELNGNYDNIINDFKIIRYVDDIFIVLDFNEFNIFDFSYSEDTRNGFIYQLLNKITDEFYEKLKLRFNGKAELFKLFNDGDLDGFKKLIKKVSEDYPETETDIDISLPDKVNRLISVIDGIKDRDVSQIYKDLSKEESETLKDVYDQNLLNLISRPDNIERFESKFNTFDFDLLRVYPQPLIILINMCPTSKVRFERYLTEKQTLTTFDRGLLVTYLAQTNFSNKNLFEKLKSNEQLKPIFDIIKTKKITHNISTGMYSVNIKKLKPLFNQVSYIEQVRQRVYSERQKQYSVALNHLLNEIHLTCSIIENKDIKKYKEPDVNNFLNTKMVDNTTKNKIKNLFDRRNNNPISHPGNDSRVAWAVEKSEYDDFQKYVKKAIEKIFE